MFATPASAQAATGAAGGGAIIANIMPLILVFGIMYFLLIRPQQKKMKQHRAMVDAMRRGDQVVTSGGIMGKVFKVNDDGIVEVEIAEAVVAEEIVADEIALEADGEAAAEAAEEVVEAAAEVPAEEAAETPETA